MLNEERWKVFLLMISMSRGMFIHGFYTAFIKLGWLLPFGTFEVGCCAVTRALYRLQDVHDCEVAGYVQK
jgi:hypothetical protein